MGDFTEKELIIMCASLEYTASENGEVLEDMLSEDDYNNLIIKGKKYEGEATLEDYKEVFLKVVRMLTN